jgi:hypothetical protein
MDYGSTKLYESKWGETGHPARRLITVTSSSQKGKLTLSAFWHFSTKRTFIYIYIYSTYLRCINKYHLPI